jgi:hypothetical protein
MLENDGLFICDECSSEYHHGRRFIHHMCHCNGIIPRL